MTVKRINWREKENLYRYLSRTEFDLENNNLDGTNDLNLSYRKF